MTKARFFSSALDGQTVTLSATQGGTTRGPNTISAWGIALAGSDWEGVTPASLTVTVNEVRPSEGTFAPYPVEWRIRVTGTSYATPDWDTEVTTPYQSVSSELEDTIRLAIEAHDPSYQRCHFVVHTGDTGNYRNTWVGSPAHRNKAYQYGQNCGHVYSTPGTYTGRSIYVYDDEGNWGTLALDDLVVTNADDWFDAASTIVVNPLADPLVAGDWTDAPAHDAANRFTTLDGAFARFEERKAHADTTKGMRICVKSGTSFTERARGISTSNTKGVCLLDTYGGSDRFTYSERNLDVDVPGSASLVDQLIYIGSPGWAFRIKNGSFDFGYDRVQGRPTNASGWSGGLKVLSRSFLVSTFATSHYRADTGLGDPCVRTVLDNCDIVGCGWFCVITEAGGNIGGRNTAIFSNDCEFYDNPEYAFMTPQSLFALGTRVYTRDGSDLGASGRGLVYGTSRGWTGHPIFVREQFAWTLYIRACYAETRGGWSGVSGALSERNSQALMRLNNRGVNEVQVGAAGWLNGRGRRYYFCDSIFSSQFPLDLDGDILKDGQPVGGAHAVVENCMIFFDPQTGSRFCISDFTGRKSIRNCVFVTLNTPPYDLDTLTATRDLTRFDTTFNKVGRFFEFISAQDNAFKFGARAENRHNTFVMLRADADIDGDGNTGGFLIRGTGTRPANTFNEGNYDMVEGHNVLHAPNLSPAPAGHVASVETIDLPAGMRVLDPYFKWSWESKTFSLDADVVNGAETPAIEYPIDWYKNPTTGADYATSANTNTLEQGVPNVSITARWFQPPKTYPNSNGVQADPYKNNTDMITVIHDCNSSGVVQGDGTGTHFKIQNRSGVTWTAGNYRVILDRSGSAGMAPDVRMTIDQATFKLYRPITPVALDSGLGSTLFDFNRNRRPNAGFAISPTSGTNAAGAILP